MFAILGRPQEAAETHGTALHFARPPVPGLSDRRGLDRVGGIGAIRKTFERQAPGPTLPVGAQDGVRHGHQRRIDQARSLGKGDLRVGKSTTNAVQYGHRL